MAVAACLLAVAVLAIAAVARNDSKEWGDSVLSDRNMFESEPAYDAIWNLKDVQHHRECANFIQRPHRSCSSGLFSEVVWFSKEHIRNVRTALVSIHGQHTGISISSSKL